MWVWWAILTLHYTTGQFYGACAQYSINDRTDHVNIDYNTFYSPNATFSDGGCAGCGQKHSCNSTDFKGWQKAGLGR